MAALATGATLGCLVPVAGASRAPSKSEKSAIQRPALKACGSPARTCKFKQARVSTRSARFAWADVFGEGFSGVLLKRPTSHSRRFKVVGIQGGGISACSYWSARAPSAVLRDLHIAGVVDDSGTVADCGKSAAAAAAALPKILTQGKPAFAVRPRSISYTGDGTGVLGGSDGSGPANPGRLRWPTYTRRRAIGRGVVWIDDCDPDCAGGTFSAVPVTVHAFSPSHGRFRRLTVKYTLHGKRYTDRRVIRRYTGGIWTYDVVGTGR